jgi:hypothetical protein
MAAPFASGTGDPGEERLAEAARLLVARRGDPVRIEEVDGDLSTRTVGSRQTAGCCPARTPPSPAPRSRSGWLGPQLV